MTNMTSGSIPRHLITYAVPLILGNFFQLTYNAVDSIILGRFAGKSSLAAVGVANPIMNIMIFFIVGICLGAGILMSEFYGAGKNDKLKNEISTTIAVGFIFTLIVSVVCFIFVKPILYAIRTPEELIPLTSQYLRIVFAGLIFTFFYNVFACTLRAVGDSRTPIICVSISAVLNGILDYVLVAILHMDMAGAAYATIASQAISCILCIGYVYIKEPLLAVKPREFHVEGALVKQTINYSWATAMQQTVLYVGKLLIQSAVNPLGVDAIATFNAGTKIDDFSYQPEQSIAHAMTTFVAQNRGAGKRDRELGGFRSGMKLEFIYAVFICLVAVLGGRWLIWLFAGNAEQNVIDMGTQYLFWMGLFYVLPAATNGIQGFFRGLGNMKITLISTTVQIVARVACSYLLAPKWGILGVAFACLAGWVVMLIYEFPLWIKTWKSMKISQPACSSQDTHQK
jgi:putative MATE family efflux protein